MKTANDRHAAETKKLNDSHAASLKLLTDSYNENVKRLTDTNATNMKLLRDGHAAQLKKVAEKYDAQVKDLEAAAAQERRRADELAVKLKTDLASAMSPAQTLDVWLPLLTDLRRPSDAEAALATATKVIAGAPGDSEDAAKARTVAGLALFLKGDLPMAKGMFTAARSSPAYRPAAAAGKPWANAADVGLRSIDDPLAPYRQPVEAPARDPRAAARFLDAGVKAYKAGRYADAVGPLADATRADATDPVAWYFLGAAKWQTGSPDKARDDFRQGAEREKVSLLPTRTISDALAPIQGAARDALSLARP